MYHARRPSIRHQAEDIQHHQAEDIQHHQAENMQQAQGQQPLANWQIDHLTCSFANVDLNHKDANLAPTFDFEGKKQSPNTIVLLSTAQAAWTCMHVKDWLLQSFGRQELFAPGIVRMESLELHLMPKEAKKAGGKGGWMLLAKDICCHQERPVTVIAVLVPGDQRVRWFYTILPVGPLLTRLDNGNLLSNPKEIQPGTHRHRRFTTYIREEFLHAVTIPHSPDYKNAEAITDCCPEIIDPSTALQRLEQNETLYFAHKNQLEAGSDISEDRYLLLLHPAEREAASVAHFKCAEYLLVKRNYFKAFFEEIYRSEKKLDRAAAASRSSVSIDAGPGEESAAAAPAAARARMLESASSPQGSFSGGDNPREGSATPVRRGGHEARRTRVRTEHAHRVCLEEVYELRSWRAKHLVVVWKELGFLDEGRYLEWVKAGGMLESLGWEGESEEDE